MVDSVDQRRKAVENELLNLRQQVDATDAKLRAYLADRENKPHPRHHELIEKIQSYRIDPHLSTRGLETMLDNLQWKIYYQSRAWRQLWENAEARRQRSEAGSKSVSPGSGGNSTDETRPRGVYSVDRLWDIQAERLEKLGQHSSESKDDFIKRIKRRYGQLASEKKADEEIIMKFSKSENRCTLELKKPGHDVDPA